jgi:hypothetical protein
MAGMVKTLRVLILLFSSVGLFAQKHAASAQSATNLPKPVSHPTICREWGNVAMGVFARYQVKYRNVLALFASQARDEEQDARSKGWAEENIRHLLGIVANTQSGRWSDAARFGEDEFNDCIEKWKASTTPAERESENRSVDKYNTEIRANDEKVRQNIERTDICQSYQSTATQLIGLRYSGASYKQASEVAVSKAYGPRGEVLRHSEENAKHLLDLVAAIYFARDKYGKSDQAFIQRAFDGCMKGELLTASK